MKWIHHKAPGLLICLTVALPAWFLGTLLPLAGGPVFALLLGMLFTRLLPRREIFLPGIAFTSKKILQSAVVMLGFGLNLSVIARTGLQSLPIILSAVTAALVLSRLLYKVLGVSPAAAVLVGVGSAVCGGSAIAAAAPVTGADDGEIAQSLSAVFLFNVAAALVFPALGTLLGMSDYGFGLFAGTAVNDTSSVTAAASAWDAAHGSNALDTATIVKLTRTLSILPITLALAFRHARKNKNAGGPGIKITKIFPFFVVFFLLASLVTTVCLSLGVPGEWFSPFKALSRFLIVTAMAAVGLNTDIVKLIKSGGRTILLGFCCWSGVAGASLVAQRLLGIL